MRHSRIIAKERALKILQRLQHLEYSSSLEELEEALVYHLGQETLDHVIDQVELAVKEYANFLSEQEEDDPS